jgi:chromosome segregation ATPase
MRVYAPLDDPAVDELDQMAKRKGISRAQLIINAIDAYLHQSEPSTKELDQLRIKLDQVNSELDQTKCELGQARINVDQASNLRTELEQTKAKYSQSTSEINQRWEETKALKKELDKLKKDLDEARSANQHLKDELLKRQSETDLLAKTREELAATRAERDKLQETISLRNQDVTFLQGHVAQLTQSISQLSLKPGEEEIKKKGWWQFWK